jgi:plastocyanin
MPPAAPMSAAIQAVGGARYTWSPASVTIAVGGTVTWSWSEPVQPHNVKGDNFPLESPITKADIVSYTFEAAGTYRFACETHPDTMRGVVVVR